MSRMSCVSVEHPAVQLKFEVAQLSRAQLVVEDYEIRPRLVARQRQRFYFASAKQQGRVRPAALLHHLQHDRHAGGGRQTAQFFERVLDIDRPIDAVGEANNRGALSRCAFERRAAVHHARDCSTRSHGTAPSRRRVGCAPRVSTIVDASPVNRPLCSRMRPTV